ncbi:hypothetical protein [Pedobacter nutrimenti]|uniref:Uncharacterized protein n=1 Tax=Pedobacter nutrimenti TaxID=1241337 RepID=A0A318UAK3_9SPHI|nr:hypothetical protein [Pedobacter nutrimenti]PYF71545.1 hypothetical protein B0O44_107160 [Pedobacter nutrimenti]
MAYKYKIDEFLENLPVKHNKHLVSQIPGILNVSRNTFRNYCKIPFMSKKDIPYGCVRKLEILFGMEPGELANYGITGRHYLDLVRQRPVKTGAKRNLKKPEQPEQD